MLANDFRPHIFDEVVGQKNVVENIRRQSVKGSLFNVYIFGGQFGSGKTTMARILAMAANCTHKDSNGNPCCECESCRSILDGNAIDVTEIDGASNNGVDQVRDLIESVGYAPTIAGRKKVYIIDEVHMLSTSAFNALLKTLEEPPAYAIFVLCTTEVNKIPATVRSRAAVYQFLQIEADDIAEHIARGAEKIGIKMGDGAAQLIAKKSKGAMRNAWRLLEQASAQSDVVTVEEVSTLLMLNDESMVFSLIGHILKGAVEDIVKTVGVFSKTGNDIASLVSDMSEIVSDAIVAAAGGETVGSSDYCASIKAISGDIHKLCSVADTLMSVKAQLRKGFSKEALIVSFIKVSSEVSRDALEERVKVLEEQVRELFKNGVPVCKTEPALNDNSEKGVVSESINSSAVRTVETNKALNEDEPASFVEIKDETGGAFSEIDAAMFDDFFSGNGSVNNTVDNVVDIATQNVSMSLSEPQTGAFFGGTGISSSAPDISAQEPLREVNKAESEGDTKGFDIAGSNLFENVSIDVSKTKEEVIKPFGEEKSAEVTEPSTKGSANVSAFVSDMNLFGFGFGFGIPSGVSVVSPVNVGESEKKDEGVNKASEPVKEVQAKGNPELPLLEAMNTDSILKNAVTLGSKRVVEDGVLKIKTPFENIRTIIQTYVEGMKLENIEVIVDSSVKL